jgi:hypothetical protein
MGRPRKNPLPYNISDPISTGEPIFTEEPVIVSMGMEKIGKMYSAFIMKTQGDKVISKTNFQPDLGVCEQRGVLMHFEKANWFRRYFATNKQLLRDNERLTTEHTEWLAKMQEMNENIQQLMKLNRLQAVEIKDCLDRAFMAEESLKTTKAELDLTRVGIKTHPGQIKAISLIQVNKGGEDIKETYAPLVLTLNSEGTEIVKRELLPDTEFNYALDQSKIELFDPVEMN